MLALLVLPRLSWATTVSVWLPLVNVVVLSWIEYGAAATVPTPFPSTLNCTLAIVAVPLAAAVAEIVMALETVLPFAGLMKVTVGGGTTLLTVTVMLALPVLPRLSWATAVSVWLPLVNV